MRKQTKSSLKRKLDKRCSEIVRKKGYCVRCHKTENLQAAHIFSRTYNSTRYDIDNNIICLCAGCHFWGHKNPIFFTEFVNNYLGNYRYELLKLKAQEIKKWTTEEMSQLLESLKSL